MINLVFNQNKLKAIMKFLHLYIFDLKPTFDRCHAFTAESVFYEKVRLR